MVNAFDFGVQMAAEMKGCLPPDSVGSKNMLVYGELAEMVRRSGDGSYLELGTWRGASAAVAALVKKKFKLGGGVVCVDHFCGYDHCYIGTSDAQKLFDNRGVTDMVIIAISTTRPFPKESAGDTFACAFIDADHWGDNPYLDFVEIQGMVARFILVDDYDPNHADLMACVERISKEFKETWKRLPTKANCVLFERITNG